MNFSQNHDLSENVHYNTPSFPAYLSKGTLSFYPDYSAVSHWHEDLEFIIILSGYMSYNIDGQLVQIDEGNGIFVNSRHMHYGFSKEREDCDFICILLHPSLVSSNAYFVSEYMEPLTSSAEYPYVPLNRSVEWQDTVIRLLEEMYSIQDNKLFVFDVQQLFINILKLLYGNLKPVKAAFSRPDMQLDTLKQMILFIETHYQNPMSLNDIAKAGSCCKSKCNTLFNKYLRTSPVNFLNDYRMKKGCNLLVSTDVPVVMIASETGFCSSSYFCETFHKMYGMTPQRFRSESKEALNK